VTFVERGPGVAHVLGVAHRTAGKIAFAPLAGRGERRSIVASRSHPTPPTSTEG